MIKRNRLFREYKRAGCIYVQMNSSTEWIYKAIILKKKKSKLIIEAFLQHSDVLDEKIINAYSSVPFHIVIDGKGVLHRKVSKEADLSENSIHLVLPQADPKDFYIQEFSNDFACWLSLVRKELLEKITDEISKKGLKITDITLGGWNIQSIFPILNNYTKEKLATPEGYTVHFKDLQITEIENSTSFENFQLAIGDDELPNDQLLVYSGAFNQFVPQNFFKKERLPIQNSYDNWVYYQLFNYSVKFFLSILFALVLLNAIVFNHYFNQNTSLRAVLSSKVERIEQVGKLRDEFKNKKNFLNLLGWQSGKLLSYYADRLAATVPGSIMLTSVEIHPLNIERLKKDRMYLFRQSEIKVSGKCKGPVDYNIWLKMLESEMWVKQIVGPTYSYNEKNGNGEFKFIIAIL